MRIRAFGNFIEVENLKDQVLKDSTIVVDAHNFFYRIYENAGLQYVYGCESDKYADYLQKYLSMFKEANVTCYFIFKGGHENHQKRLARYKEKDYGGKNFDINKQYKKNQFHYVLPIFMKDVYKQVLDEMEFNYTICEYESKKECIALAQKLRCPVVSYDIEFCFSGMPYIMQSTLKFDEKNKQIRCRIFSLDDFLRKYHLTVEKLALFEVLTDEQEFPENYFMDFFKALRCPLNCYNRIPYLFSWLAENTREEALDRIFRYINQEDRIKFLNVEQKVREMIRTREKPGIPTKYLENGNQIEITEKDEFWFEKGVASKHIGIQLVNLTRSGIAEATWAIADYSDNDAILLSMDIKKYMYNLLTNFENKQLIFFNDGTETPIPVTNSIQKPEYEANSSPFENGWKHLKGELFKHFLSEALQGFDFEEIDKLAEDLRMLMTALLYFSEKKPINTRNEVCSIILSYIALGVVTRGDRNNNLSSENSINDNDKMIAKGILAKYLADVRQTEAKRIFDVKLLHPLVEFQHCLENLNYLNVLCGKLYKPTIYSNTYNGTFVYKVLYTIKTEYDGNCMDFLKQELNSAPTVLAYIQSLMKVHDNTIDDVKQ